MGFCMFLLFLPRDVLASLTAKVVPQDVLKLFYDARFHGQRSRFEMLCDARFHGSLQMRPPS